MTDQLTARIDTLVTEALRKVEEAERARRPIGTWGTAAGNSRRREDGAATSSTKGRHD